MRTEQGIVHKIPSTDPGRLWGSVNSVGLSVPTPQPCQSLLCPRGSTLYSHTPSLWVSISNPTLPWICFICGHQYPPHAKSTDPRLKELVPASQWHVTLMASSIVRLSLSLASTMPTLSSVLLPVSWSLLSSPLTIRLHCPPPEVGTPQDYAFGPLLTQHCPWGSPPCSLLPLPACMLMAPVRLPSSGLSADS